MSRNTRTHRSRGLAAAGLLVAASVGLPQLTHAQSTVPEHALLNRVPATAGVPLGLRGFFAGSADPGLGGTAERALLGRSPEAAWSARFERDAVPVQRSGPVIDGKAALLGKSD